MIIINDQKIIYAGFCENCEWIKKRGLGRPAGRPHNYFALIQALVTSNMRLEKPHSLSYQANTLTKLSITLV